MSDGAFSDAITQATATMWGKRVSPGDRAEARAVLATPEMQAIRRQLLSMADNLIDGCNDTANHGPPRNYPAEEAVRWYLSECLPASVVEWVMGDE